MGKFDSVKVGDTVVRVLANIVKMPLVVSEVTDTQIICGHWTFDKATGAEIDEYLGWGPEGTGTCLVSVQHV